jgi:hypothetical protein
MSKAKTKTKANAKAKSPSNAKARKNAIVKQGQDIAKNIALVNHEMRIESLSIVSKKSASDLTAKEIAKAKKRAIPVLPLIEDLKNEQTHVCFLMYQMLLQMFDNSIFPNAITFYSEISRRVGRDILALCKLQAKDYKNDNPFN